MGAATVTGEQQPVAVVDGGNDRGIDPRVDDGAAPGTNPCPLGRAVDHGLAACAAQGVLAIPAHQTAAHAHRPGDVPGRGMAQRRRADKGEALREPFGLRVGEKHRRAVQQEGKTSPVRGQTQRAPAGQGQMPGAAGTQHRVAAERQHVCLRLRHLGAVFIGKAMGRDFLDHGGLLMLTAALLYQLTV